MENHEYNVEIWKCGNVEMGAHRQLFLICTSVLGSRIYTISIRLRFSSGGRAFFTFVSVQANNPLGAGTPVPLSPISFLPS